MSIAGTRSKGFSNDYNLDISISYIYAHILLRHDFRDYDSLPFKFYNVWLCWDGFEEIVSNAWNDPKFNMDCPFSRFKNKLKNVKNCLKSWVATVRVNINKEKK